MKMFPCGNSRREFVWQMGGGFAGLALTSLLDRDGFFSRQAMAGDNKGPLAVRPAQIPTKAKACIFLMMNGAPSQVDTFDPKPALTKHHGKPYTGDAKVGGAAPFCRARVIRDAWRRRWRRRN